MSGCVRSISICRGPGSVPPFDPRIGCGVGTALKSSTPPTLSDAWPGAYSISESGSVVSEVGVGRVGLPPRRDKGPYRLPEVLKVRAVACWETGAARARQRRRPRRRAWICIVGDWDGSGYSKVGGCFILSGPGLLHWSCRCTGGRSGVLEKELRAGRREVRFWVTSTFCVSTSVWVNHKQEPPDETGDTES